MGATSSNLVRAPISHTNPDNISLMSTAVPRSKPIQSLQDMNTQVSLAGSFDDVSMLPDVPELQGGGEPKFTPYYAMEKLWQRMGPREQTELQQYHVKNYY